MALDNATQQFLAAMAEQGGKGLHEMTVSEARGLGGMLKELYGSGPEVARVVDVTMGEDAIPGRVIVPNGEVRGVFIYYHGGGWVIGALDEFDALGRKLAVRTKCAVVLVDYRLAPEHRFPVAVDDAYAALEWVAARRAEFGGAADAPIVIGGDSAGGNLTAVVAQRARDRGGPEVALQVLVYPVTDADVDNASYTDPANALMLTREAMIWFWDHYAPDASQRAHPDASPLQADDLSGLPPALVLTAEHDVLRDEGEAYAEALKAAGNAVEFHRVPGQMHGFFTMLNLPGSQTGLEHVGDVVDGALG